MIRTKGLGRALGIVIKRVLRREVSGDADEAPQRQRPTISAHRQREVVPIDEYAQHVDHEQPEEAAVDYVVTNAESFLGEPHDTSVLMDYVYYVVAKVWNGGERPALKLSFHGKKVEKFGRPAPEIEGLVAATRLSPLIACSLNIGDQGLISAFAERWHKETSSFHLLVGECWIYKHFPSIVFSIAVEDYHERKPCASLWKSGKASLVSTYHKRLDRLTSDVVCWIPYGDHVWIY
ncbi:uncharacterized protein [Glycine max]|uniref:uncharacterized protein n=1 Tax=Glycine max TaxID=3847 RepID=UPI0007191E6D|nr:uncharacterized protein LOC102667684 [Glycine max]|eukprot:XP_006589925.2 uncharacterized protein LOC102667684 [Glycine max]